MTESRTLLIVNKLGLHARAAVKLVELAQSFDAKVSVHNEESSAEADSVMALLMLESAQGEHVTVTADGAEASQALNAICSLIEEKFEEDE
ncbi:phosphate ABC transporter permease [Vibrio breoganii]|uniref:HPr family phosphocarrier protein n=1 Tax=Vibrio breoganii TaxID=553239 RepID=UPI00080E2E5C|nr:HPr family phosphocarrier protein [Vibrio breoganii]OCH76492.1 phosphate ABC transporter permease [Vibrio breoganii]PMG85109.1 phosphate ABC transporter permease [Vibrio breoganii]PMK33015.1 phosphate ABC transporter permease [Vibrio breoganii]PML25904.1 phosphate ABC transporter permease [Vibrio breoganii]PMM08492.1 phosphate ABC transporter permease [Vibrio breoganii]